MSLLESLKPGLLNKLMLLALVLEISDLNELDTTKRFDENITSKYMDSQVYQHANCSFKAKRGSLSICLDIGKAMKS